MPHKDEAARRKYLRDRYAASAELREAERVRLAKWRRENKGKVREQNLRQDKKHTTRNKARKSDWYERNRDRQRLKRGLPVPTRPCPANCELCGIAPDRDGTGRFKVLALDHCHATGDFRGWLCNKCNAGIGALGDTIEGLKRAIAYLERAEMLR
jgi:hypothetical protein